MKTIITNTQIFHINKYNLKGHLSFREFKKNIPYSLIYESILIKVYMNDNIMNTQIF